jgi:hypothetical protein
MRLFDSNRCSFSVSFCINISSDWLSGSACSDAAYGHVDWDQFGSVDITDISMMDVDKNMVDHSMSLFIHSFIHSN